MIYLIFSRFLNPK
uniref:Uncharacterized protein n=1 Tax=Rhizophora mucronata TaxID=61149 RepID=A0A2P2QM35_RHIMU